MRFFVGDGGRRVRARYFTNNIIIGVYDAVVVDDENVKIGTRRKTGTFTEIER